MNIRGGGQQLRVESHYQQRRLQVASYACCAHRTFCSVGVASACILLCIFTLCCAVVLHLCAVGRELAPRLQQLLQAAQDEDARKAAVAALSAAKPSSGGGLLSKLRGKG